MFYFNTMKTNALTVFITLLGSSLFSQTGVNLQWEEEFTNVGGPHLQELNAITGGSGFSTVVGESSSADGIQMYVAQYNSAAELQWETSVETENYSSCELIVDDNQGNYYAAGYEVIGNFNQHRIHLVRLDGNGDLIWHSTYLGSNDMFASPLDLTLKGDHLYICGRQTGENGYDIAMVAKFDLDGDLIWEGEFDAGTQNKFEAVDANDAGIVLAVGDVNLESSFLAVQFSDVGDMLWQYPESIDLEYDRYYSDVVASNDGDFLVTGTKETDGWFEENIITQKFSTTNTPVWEVEFSNEDTNAGRHVLLGSDNSVLTIGELQEESDFSVIILAYDENGNEQWSSTYTIDFDTTVLDVEVDSDGNIYIAVEDDDYAIAKFSSSGEFLVDAVYSDDVVDPLKDIALTDGYVIGCALGDDNKSSVISLESLSLAENYFLETQGESQSDMRPGKLITDDNHLWLSTYSDDGQAALFSIVKMDLSGNELWEVVQNYPTTIPLFNYLDHDASGNVIGLFENSPNIFGGDLGLIKYDGDGNEIFTTLINDEPAYKAGGIAVDNAGDIYITGSNSSLNSMFLSKYSSGGVLEWTELYQSPALNTPQCFPYDMMLTDAGKLLIATRHKGEDDDIDLHIFQYAADGTLEWHTDVADQEGNLTDFAGMHSAPNGDVTIFGSSSIGNYCVARYSDDGTELWAETGALATNSSRSLSVDEAGEVYLCFSGTTGAYIRKLDNSGGLVGDAEFIAEGSEGFYFPRFSALVNGQLVVLADHDGQPVQFLLDSDLSLVYDDISNDTFAALIGGTVDNSDGIYGAYTIGDFVLSDGWKGSLVRKYNVGIVGVEDAEKPEDLLRVFPNPVGEHLQVSVSSVLEGATVMLMDMGGNRVQEFSLPSARGEKFLINLDTSELKPGMYLLRLKADDKTCSAPIIRY